MAKLTKKQVRKTAKLAKLELTFDEVKVFQKQLTKVIEYISELNEVDTKGQEEKARNTSLKNVYRQDSKELGKNTLSQDEALSASQNSDKQFFTVPMVLSEKKTN